MRTIWALLCICSASAIANAEESFQTAGVLQKGDLITISNPSCREEYQIRGLLPLLPMNGERRAFEMADRSWGKNVCRRNTPPLGASYDVTTVYATYFRTLSDPIEVENKRNWIVEVWIKGTDKKSYSYLGDYEIQSLLERSTYLAASGVGQ